MLGGKSRHSVTSELFHRLQIPANAKNPHYNSIIGRRLELTPPKH
jgi:hypothetical protein